LVPNASYCNTGPRCLGSFCGWSTDADCAGNPNGTACTGGRCA
jgi:hypothetical protein